MTISPPVVDHTLIHNQLENILSSPLFINSAQLCKILSFLVEETLAGRGPQLKAYTVAIEALGRNEDFDPASDSIVRAQVRRLRMKLKKYYEGEGKNSKVRIEVPLNSYVPKFIEKDEENSSDEFFNASRLLIKKSWRPSILVLPFVNNTPDARYEYFSNGISERLSIALSKFQDLEVLNIYATLGAPEQESVYDLSKKLQNRFLLEGSYCIIKEEMRVSVRLSDMEKLSILWADTLDFKYPSVNLFQLEDLILKNILSFVGGDFGKISQCLLNELAGREMTSLGPYDAILRYYDYTIKCSFTKHQKVKSILEHCLNQINGSPPTIYAALGDVYISDYKFGFDQIPNALEKAENLIHQALEMDSSLQMGHLAMANLCSIQHDEAGLKYHVEQVLAINPNNYPAVAAALSWYALHSNLEDGCAQMRKIYQLNDLTVPFWYHLPFFIMYYRQGDYEQALHAIQQYKKTDTQSMAEYYLLLLYAKMGKKAEVEHNIEMIRNCPMNRRNKLDRIIRCVLLEETICDEFLGVLRQYDLVD